MGSPESLTPAATEPCAWERPTDTGGPLTSGRSRWLGRSVGAAGLRVDALGFFKLVFEDDDPACGLDRGALVDELTRTGRDAQLVAGVTAVTALGAQWCDQSRFADGAEEAWSGTEQFGGPAHRVGGVVVVIETA
jgi:hypothetical protein